MKFFIVIAGLLSVSVAEEKTPASTSPLVYTKPVYTAAPYAFSGYTAAPYAAAYHPYAYGYAPYAATQYVAAAPTLVLTPVKAEEPKKEVVAAPAPIVAAATPLVYANQPVAYAAPAPAYYAHAPVYGYAAAYPHSASSQYHAQDEFKNVNYGYTNINSAKFESGNANVGVQGGYQYVDANGKLQVVNYVADGLGFRVADSRLPVGPEVPETAPLEAPVFTGEAPKPVEDTKEVAAARAEFLAAFEKAKQETASRKKRESDPGLFYGYAGGFLPYTYGAGYIRPTALTYGVSPYPYQAGYGPRSFYYAY